MIDAFAAGGDFHSRTAMGMYPHVAEAIRKGEVLLELDEAAVAAAKATGKKPALLKNVFASERRKAKVSGDGAMGRWGDGAMGRWSDGAME